MSTPPPAPETNLLHFNNLGLFSNLLKNSHEITLIDVPVSYKASTAVLCTLT